MEGINSQTHFIDGIIVLNSVGVCGDLWSEFEGFNFGFMWNVIERWSEAERWAATVNYQSPTLQW